MVSDELLNAFSRFFAMTSKSRVKGWGRGVSTTTSSGGGKSGFQGLIRARVKLDLIYFGIGKQEHYFVLSLLSTFLLI